MDISFVLCVVTLHIFPLEQPTINKYRVCHFHLCGLHSIENFLCPPLTLVVCSSRHHLQRFIPLARGFGLLLETIRIIRFILLVEFFFLVIDFY